MKKLKCDILIVGAGLSGLITAFVLSKLDLKIAVVDKFNFTSNKSNFFDLRTTAISEGSKDFLNKIKLWGKLEKHTEPIKKIKVIDRKALNFINFNNKEKNKNLGYIVKNSIIKATIIKLIQNKKNVKLLNNMTLQKIYSNNNIIETKLNKLQVISKLLIAADGKNSTVRNFLKTPIYKKKYDQKALVVNFHHTKNHNSVAYELFYKSGPLAILPMKKFKNKLYSSSLIWTHNKKYIDALSKINKNLLLLILEEKINKYTGNIEELIDIQTFNLSAHLNSNFYENRVIYIGDSAHSIHPIAGQGWNIAIRDIDRCLEIIHKNIELGLDIGGSNTCKTYHEQTYYDSFSLYQITNNLNSIFLKDDPLFYAFRKLGFKIINKKNFLKDYITNFAMGY